MSDLSKVCERLRDQAASVVLGARLADLQGYHVEFGCACGRTVVPAVKLLIARYGPDRRLADITDRARCRQCGARPVRAWLNETHNREFCHGAAPGWSVQLRPFPTPASVAEAAE